MSDSHDIRTVMKQAGLSWEGITEDGKATVTLWRARAQPFVGQGRTMDEAMAVAFERFKAQHAGEQR